ncbi:colipase-like [Centruroides sculpturatus]|uniref:colipase-like n=1 Tax=Centruroides sculpturatus TaxID=218467 RepID=UPI000C6DAD11|nr:colipase-like [Centruroides sculpturatus]
MANSFRVLIVILCLVNAVLTQDGYMEQRMINSLTDEIIPYKHGLSNGEYCINSAECLSGCCLKTDNSRKCSPKSLKGEMCSNSVLKGEIYRSFCPCISGKNACSNVKGRNGICYF